MGQATTVDMDGVRVDWPDEKKWLHVRGSNTEPIMRIIVEALDLKTAKELMHRVHELIANHEPSETPES